MTTHCIQSLIATTRHVGLEIILVESNKQFPESEFSYPEQVKVIIPEPGFNFHKFLNIGILASSGAFVALCNNDLVFHENWFGPIAALAARRPDVVSFSPEGQPNTNPGKYKLGWRTMQELKGWCIVARRSLFDTTGMLDETFDFYYADNDYAMNLRRHNLKHAVVYDSYVAHLDKDPEVKRRNYAVDPQTWLHKYELPKHLQGKALPPILAQEKVLSGYIKFHNKWGAPKWLYRRTRLADFLMRSGLGFLNRLFI